MLVLASASPRRKEIFASRGIYPLIIPSNAEEKLPEGAKLSPEETAVYLADLKASAVAGEIGADRHETELSGVDRLMVVGVDTIVFRGEIIEKPRDEADALRILRALANGIHTVISGVSLIEMRRQEGRQAGSGTGHRPTYRVVGGEKFYDSTDVAFGDYSDDEILEYVRSEQPYDKSGSYAIQSSWGRHVRKIDGSVENVIGLPVDRILGALGLVKQ
ncbi:MAG: Maf family protein [Clostridiales Family XIII bacterium]|nr:Maf family protein [Clostridiales Family XIII bacterium]